MSIKNLVNLDDNKLREMNVGKKFAHTFTRIYIYLGLSLCLLIISIAVGISGYHKLITTITIKILIRGFFVFTTRISENLLGGRLLLVYLRQDRNK